MHYIRKSLIYSMRKAFLEDAIVEVVYKFDGSLPLVFEKGESTAKLPFNLFGWSHTYTYKWTPTTIT